MNRKIAKYKEFIALLEILYKEGYTNKEIAELINITPPHLSKIKSEQKNVTDKVLHNMKLLIYKSEKFEFVEPKKEEIVKGFDSELSDIWDEGKYEKFMSIINSYYDIDYKDKQIADLINIDYSQISLIKNKQRNVTDEILIRLSHYFEKVMPIVMFKKTDSNIYLLENINIEYRLEDKDQVKAIIEETSKFYRDKISELKDKHLEETNRLNESIENLLFIIDKYKKDGYI